VWQIKLPPASIIKSGLRIFDLAAEISIRTRGFSLASCKLVPSGDHPGLDALVCQLAFLAWRVPFLESPVGVEREALARLLG
jgi:hypothetical protein